MQDGLFSSVLALSDTVKLARRPLPDTGDGKYAYQVAPKQTTPIPGPTAAQTATHSGLTLLVTKLKTLLRLGAPIEDPEGIIKAALQFLESPNAIDDRQGLFVQVLALLCKLPQDTKFAKDANAKAITLLYNSLPHPPAAYIGSDAPGAVPWTQANAQSTSPSAPASSSAAPSWGSATTQRAPWAFRAADGSSNNVWQPALGQSGRPYARDVQGTTPQPASGLPDAGDVFDALLRSRGDFVPHPGGNSALTFAYASLVTHSLFRSNPADPAVNNTTSYLDLSPLYGTNQSEQDLVRDKAGGRGHLWNDAFAEDRLVLVPPAASALLVVFSRNHNYIADMLLKINERKRWADPASLSDAKRAQQDEELFQTARLVNCGHFMAMIFGDYVGGFLGLPRDGVGWCMNPFDDIKTSSGEFLGRGEGNHVSVEFNLLYRWHAVTAQHDIQWTDDLFARVFPGKDAQSLTPADFGAVLGRSWATLVDPNPRTRTFANLVRGPDGKFDDDAIADILQTATETPAGAYRARGHPAVFKAVEVMSIEQGRRWGVCTMNEFRSFLGLKPFSSFQEWNSSVPGVAEAAKKLYGHIDNLELYPGIQAEDCMPLGPGSGICCGYTMTRAILGDAVALVRGDRFYTSDYTPANLTSWGFQDCARDPNNGAFGAALPRLLMRHLPRHYPATSVYSLFPFFTPQVTKANLTRLGQLQGYTDTEKRPQAGPKPVDVKTPKDVRYVLGKPEVFVAQDSTDDFAWGAKAVDADAAAKALGQVARDCVQRHAYTVDGLPGARLDAVGVCNRVAARWAADFLLGVPLKTKETPDGLFTELEVYGMLETLWSVRWGDVPAEARWALEQQAEEAAGTLRRIVEAHLDALSPGPVSAVVSYLSSFIWPTERTEPFNALLTRLVSSHSPNTISTALVTLAAATAVPLAQRAALALDFYMSNPIPDVAAASQGYAREAARLRPRTPVLARTATAADAEIGVKPGATLAVYLTEALLDPSVFSTPQTIDPSRPEPAYASLIPMTPLGASFDDSVVGALLGAVLELPRVRRAPGALGVVAGFKEGQAETFLDTAGSVGAGPGKMVVVYDV